MADRPPGARDHGTDAPESIPFYRNVKLIGVIAQIVFLVLAVAAVVLLVRNVRSGLAVSGLTISFDFIDNRAGFALGDTPIAYDRNDSYLRALIVGVLNTLRVAVIGIVLCSLLGVAVALMRLSDNWLLRQIAILYIELFRNTPLPVQLIFWYYAVILAVPPLIGNSWNLGPFYLSQVGLALPWLDATPRFAAWLPWLIGALAALIGLYVWRRNALERSERPGNPWPLPLLAAAVIAAAGYGVALLGAAPVAGSTAALSVENGRGTVFVDANDNGRYDARSERALEGVPLRLRVVEGQIEATSQNLTESRRIVESTFRFPEIRASEAERIEVRFEDPEAAEGLAIHFERFPSVGRIYRDRDGDEVFDPGEEAEVVDGERRTFNALGLVLEVEGFERRIVSDRGGRVLFPPFDPVGAEASEGGADDGGAGSGEGGGLGALFGPPGGDGEEAAEAVETEVDFRPFGPLVYSAPTVPRSEYFGGASLSGAFLALMLGLAVYTASFVAEIVRGGIQAVSKGQTEAAKALGLSGSQVFRLVVFPQAVRIILPPMISQYLNLTKNSSLAILVTFEDFFNVSNIVGNQTGQFIPVYIVILVGYLGISLLFSFVLNIVNERMALVER